MSVFLPILYVNNKPVVNIDGVNEELLHQIVVYKKVTFDGNINYVNPSEYYNEDGTENKEPKIDIVVYKKLGKYNQDREVYDNKTHPSNTYYIHNNQVDLLRDPVQGGRKPKRLSHLSKKRAMKPRRVRKSKRRYSRRKY